MSAAAKAIVDEAAANAWTSASQKASTDRARNDVRRAAMYLAQQGLSIETIRAAMADMCETATTEAVAYVARYDAAEAAELAADREDYADECAVDAKRQRELESGS